MVLIYWFFVCVWVGIFVWKVVWFIIGWWDGLLCGNCWIVVYWFLLGYLVVGNGVGVYFWRLVCWSVLYVWSLGWICCRMEVWLVIGWFGGCVGLFCWNIRLVCLFSVFFYRWVGSLWVGGLFWWWLVYCVVCLCFFCGRWICWLLVC